jgi:hypothetical protein
MLLIENFKFSFIIYLVLFFKKKNYLIHANETYNCLNSIPKCNTMRYDYITQNLKKLE